MKVNLKRNVETIKWSDEPGSKEYEISFDDSSLLRMKEAMEDVKESGKAIEEDSRKAYDVFKKFITTVAGEECYKDAVAYVDKKDVGERECTIMLEPLIFALVDVIEAHMPDIQEEKLAKYLRKSNGKSELV